MKAVAVLPGQPGSIHLREVPRPELSELPNGRGVLVKVLRVGVDGTDKEINQAEYGNAPDGCDYLILGHESFGIVEDVGPGVWELQPGDYVVAMVRRPGQSLYDQIGFQDMTTDSVYYERGINLRHGFLTEFYLETPEYLIKIPRAAKQVGVLLEPTSIAEKGIAQAYEIQRRLHVWRPRRAAVMGAGTLGLLANMALRLRGLETYTFGRRPGTYTNAELIQEIGARYVSTQETSMAEIVEKEGPFDLIFEATGNSAVAFEAATALAKNGVLVLASITGGERLVEVPADRINLEFVLGNKVMFGTVNASREDFERGAADLTQCAAEYPGWLEKLLTHKVDGLEQYGEVMRLLTDCKEAIKVYVEVTNHH